MNATLTPFDYNDIYINEACWIDDKPHFTRRAIGELLEYQFPKETISKIIDRNPHISQFSTVVNLTTVQNTGKGQKYDRMMNQEVYNPIGLQLIVFESNQPKARQYKIAVAHLVQAYMKGELIPNGTPSSDRLDRLEKTIEMIVERLFPVIQIHSGKVLPISIERKRSRFFMPGSALRYPEVRELIIQMRLEFATYESIAEALKIEFLDQPEKHPSKSAIGRFWQRYRKGELKEFGIDVRHSPLLEDVNRPF